MVWWTGSENRANLSSTSTSTGTGTKLVQDLRDLEYTLRRLRMKGSLKDFSKNPGYLAVWFPAEPLMG